MLYSPSCRSFIYSARFSHPKHTKFFQFIVRPKRSINTKKKKEGTSEPRCTSSIVYHRCGHLFFLFPYPVLRRYFGHLKVQVNCHGRTQNEGITNLREASSQPIISFLKWSPKINNLHTQLFAQVYTGFWINSACFICSY